MLHEHDHEITGSEVDRRIAELFEALRRVRALTELVPVCGSCKSIRDDDGEWRRMEEFFTDHLRVRFSHGYCPGCASRLMAELES